jgi:ribonuclease HI
MQLTIQTDGGSRGNPGPAAVGVVVYDETGAEVWTLSLAIGVATNNEAEYRAFRESLDWLLSSPLLPSVTKIDWKLDSNLVVQQLLKNWKIKEPRMLVLVQDIWKKLALLSCSYTIIQVPREQNVRADQLVNLAFD